MGFLTNLLNTVKRNTLDKTDLDERAYNFVTNAANSGKNFFTQKIPQQTAANFKWAGDQVNQNIVQPVKKTIRNDLQKLSYASQQEKQNKLRPSTLLQATTPIGQIGRALRTDYDTQINKVLSGDITSNPILNRITSNIGLVAKPVINTALDFTIPKFSPDEVNIVKKVNTRQPLTPEEAKLAETMATYNTLNLAFSSGLKSVNKPGPKGSPRPALPEKPNQQILIGEEAKPQIEAPRISPEDVKLQEILDQRKKELGVKPEPNLKLNKSLLEKRQQAITQGQGTDVSELPGGDYKWQPDWVKIEKDRIASLVNSEPPPESRRLSDIYNQQQEVLPPKPAVEPPPVRQPVTADTKLQDVISQTKPKVNKSDFELRRDNGTMMSDRAKVVAEDKPFVNRVLSGNLQQKEVNRIKATKLIEPIAKIDPKDADSFMKAVQDPKLQSKLPQYKDIFEYVSRLTKKAFQVATDAGIRMQQQENYFPQKWKTDLANDFRVGQKTLSKKFGNAKAKVIESIAKGQELGYEYYFDSPAEALEHYLRYMKNTITNWETVDSLRKSGALVPEALAKGQKGMVRVEAYGLPEATWISPEGKEYIGNWYAEEKLANKLNVIFGDKGVNPKLGTVARVFKRGQDWILSGGIPGTAANFFTAVQALYKDLPVSLSNPEHLKTVARSLYEGRTNNSANRIFSEKSDVLIRMARNDISNPSSYTAKSLVENKLIDTFIETQGNIKERLVGTWDKLLNDPTFKRHMALKKVFMFEDYSRQFQGKGMSQADADAVAAKVVKGFFGEDPMIKRALEDKNLEAWKTIATMAHKYREGIIGTGRYIGQSVLPKNWKDPNFTVGRQLLLGSVILQLGGEAFNFALNGHSSSDNETSLKGKLKVPVGKMMGYTDEKKDLVIGLALPSHSSLTALPRSLVETGKELVQGKTADATDTMIGNTSVLAQPFLRTLANRDAFGNQIVGEFDEDKGSKIYKTFYNAWQQPIIKGVRQATEADSDIEKVKATAQMLEMPFRVYNQKALNSSHYYEGMDKVKQGMDPATLKDWEATRRTKTGDFAQDFADEAAKANIYLRRPELLQKELEVAQYVAQKTGQPINPLLLLDKEQQMVIMRMKTLPPGADKSALYKLNQDWLTPYYDSLTAYSKKMIELGIFKDTDTTAKSEDYAPLKASPELQKKLDYYNTLPSGTGARSAFLRANPDVAEFFQQSTDISNEKRAALGLPPKDSTFSSFGNSANKTSPEQTLLKDLLASSNKSRTASIASRKKLSAITKESSSGNDAIKKKLKDKKTKVSDKPILKTKIKT